MTKLFSLCALLFCFHSAALASSESAQLEKLQNLIVVMRVPEQVCKEAAELQPYLSSEGRLAYDETLNELKENLKNSKASARFLNKAKSCVKDCTCQIFEDLGDLFTKAQGKLLQTVKTQAAGMTDKDFIGCQKKVKLTCSSKNIQQALTQAKKAKAEQNP